MSNIFSYLKHLWMDYIRYFNFSYISWPHNNSQNQSSVAYTFKCEFKKENS